MVYTLSREVKYGMYTVKELALLTGLTPRTLRYYDGIGLLRPGRSRENDYRLYGPEDVDRLQQILLYRALGLPLEEIRRILDEPDFDRAGAHGAAYIHNRYDTLDFLSAEMLEKTTAHVLEFSKTMANARVFPVEKKMPQNMVEEIDKYLYKKELQEAEEEKAQKNA